MRKPHKKRAKAKVAAERELVSIGGDAAVAMLDAIELIAAEVAADWKEGHRCLSLDSTNALFFAYYAAKGKSFAPALEERVAE